MLNVFLNPNTQYRVLLGKGVQLLCYTDTGPNHKKVGLKIKAKTIRKENNTKETSVIHCRGTELHVF